MTLGEARRATSELLLDENKPEEYFEHLLDLNLAIDNLDLDKLGELLNDEAIAYKR